jgi:hypothetical protein
LHHAVSQARLTIVQGKDRGIDRAFDEVAELQDFFFERFEVTL